MVAALQKLLNPFAVLPLRAERNRSVCDALVATLLEPLVAELGEALEPIHEAKGPTNADPNMQYLIRQRFHLPSLLPPNLMNVLARIGEGTPRDDTVYLGFVIAHAWKPRKAPERYGHAAHVRWGLHLEAAESLFAVAEPVLNSLRARIDGGERRLPQLLKRPVTGIESGFWSTFLGRQVDYDDLGTFESTQALVRQAALDLRAIHDALADRARPTGGSHA